MDKNKHKNTAMISTSENVHMLRCAAAFATATYAKVGLVPQALRALPLAHFPKSLKI
jgi:hypothetical protein